MSLKLRVYETIADPPEGYRLGELVTGGILVLIAVNVLVGVFETVKSLHQAYFNFFFYFEAFSVITFTVEYLLRFWSCTAVERYQGAIKGRLKLTISPMALIDLAAILPFYLSAVMKVDLRFVRILRLFRLFRLFRSGRLAESFRTLAAVVKNKKEELGLSLLVVTLVLILSSSVMFLVEHEQPKTQFTSVPASMWWGVMTITTIGYGDMYPVTPLGRVIASFVGFLGICCFALPVGILGAGFAEYMDQKTKAEQQQQREEEAEQAAELAAAEEAIAEHDLASSKAEPAGSTGLTSCPHCGGDLEGHR
jgi:voltage-gated potassium channel